MKGLQKSNLGAHQVRPTLSKETGSVLLILKAAHPVGLTGYTALGLDGYLCSQQVFGYGAVTFSAALFLCMKTLCMSGVRLNIGEVLCLRFVISSPGCHVYPTTNSR